MQINNITKEVRGWEKSQNVLRHDVAHILLMEEKRKKSSNTWFLTRDASLRTAASCNANQNNPYCFHIIDFLQSISPFVVEAEATPLADTFALFFRG
jgi:hypothetical protein